MYYSALTGGFYTRDIHGDAIPADAVEITADRHAALMAAQASGKAITADADGFPIASDPPLRSLEQMREQALASVVAAASMARDNWRTPGKDGVYLSKQTEAAAWLAAGSPDDLANYPYIKAEVGITSATAAELVALWQAMSNAWALASAEIERIEMTAKASIKTAKTHEAVTEVLAGLVWPAP